MAQRKKRAAARRGKAAMRGKARKPAKSAQTKAAKRLVAKTRPKKQVTKAKPKRVAAKKAAPSKAMPPKQPGKPQAETVIVDMIEEPVPGVLVITEFEATGIRAPNANPEQPEESRSAAPPKSEAR
jgi:hypothetical protein